MAPRIITYANGTKGHCRNFMPVISRSRRPVSSHTQLVHRTEAERGRASPESEQSNLVNVW